MNENFRGSSGDLSNEWDFFFFLLVCGVRGKGFFFSLLKHYGKQTGLLYEANYDNI